MEMCPGMAVAIWQSLRFRDKAVVQSQRKSHPADIVSNQLKTWYCETKNQHKYIDLKINDSQLDSQMCTI